jgi:uncharacterized protein (DUF433 family)
MPQSKTGVSTSVSDTLDFPLSDTNLRHYPGGTLLSDPGTVAVSSAVLQRDRIMVDPNVLGGEPYVRGTRTPICVILDGLVEGLTREELMEHYPRLTLQDIRAALEYAATMALSPKK